MIFKNCGARVKTWIGCWINNFHFIQSQRIHVRPQLQEANVVKTMNCGVFCCYDQFVQLKCTYAHILVSQQLHLFWWEVAGWASYYKYVVSATSLYVPLCSNLVNVCRIMLIFLELGNCNLDFPQQESKQSGSSTEFAFFMQQIFLVEVVWNSCIL